MSLQKTEIFMQQLAHALQDMLAEEHGKRMAFTLLISDFGDAGMANYISNSKREDMVKMLRETADRLEGYEDIPPVQGNA